MRYFNILLCFFLFLAQNNYIYSAENNQSQSTWSTHVEIGMSKKQVELAWGKPLSISHGKSKNNKGESWHYNNSRRLDGKTIKGKKILYFHNDILVSYSYSTK